MDVKILKQDQKIFEIEINNKKVTVNVVKFNETQNLAHLEIAGQPYKISTTSNQSGSIIYIHNTNTQVLLKKSVKKHQPLISGIKPDSHDNATKSIQTKNLSIKSPLAGRIVKIFVKNNDQVNKNTPLLSIESMKMENEIRAPFDAFVKNILISEGNLVQQNQVLITFEKEGEGDAGELSIKKILQGR